MPLYRCCVHCVEDQPHIEADTHETGCTVCDPLCNGRPESVVKAEALREAAAAGLPVFGSQSEFHKGKWTTYYSYTQRIDDWLLERAANLGTKETP